MINDIISQEGALFLGSRLKRLSDNLLNDATKIVHNLGYTELFPSHMAILKSLMQVNEISITQLAQNLGLSQPSVTRNVNSLKKIEIVSVKSSKTDNRQKLISLSPKGIKICNELDNKIWKNITQIMLEITQNCNGDFQDQILHIETNLNSISFYERFMMLNNQKNLEIIEYSNEYAGDFYKINQEWIEETFILEDIDKQVLSNPQKSILDNGGIILLARHKELGIIGTCAIMKMGNGIFELTKMGVSKYARGLKIGETLLKAILNRAQIMKIPNLFLLTNKKAQAAIHLYEKLGFVHSKEIMEKYGNEYERCDVAMKYVGN